MQLDIPIRPTSSVYATYRRLSYKPWYAIAEFVDNTTQSYFDHREELQNAYNAEGLPVQLLVTINYDLATNTLEIIDNAFGMEHADFLRAVVLDSPPANPSGRSEYGMGLKTAACWFGTHWTVESTQLGSDRLFRATIDVEDLENNHPDSIRGSIEYVDPALHFTHITIEGIYHPLRERTIGRIKDQLGSMYREDLRSGEITIMWNGNAITFEEQPILVTSQNGVDKRWKKEVEFTVPWDDGGTELPVKGWIGIRASGKQRDAGFVLLRRGRVIQGGPGEGYRPPEVFGAPNMFRSQRLIGEFHMDAWPVTQAKDQFDWTGGLEDAFIEQLIDVCREYGDFADSYRAPAEVRVITPSEMDKVTKTTRDALSRPEFGRWLKQQIEDRTVRSPQPQVETEPDDAVQPQGNEPPDENPEVSQGLTEPGASNLQGASENTEIGAEQLQRVSNGPIVYTLNLDSSAWTLRLHWQSQLADAPWMKVTHPSHDLIEVYLNTAHPFVTPYLQERAAMEFLHRFIVAFAVAEKLALEISTDGRVAPTEFRVLMSRILRMTAELEVATSV